MKCFLRFCCGLLLSFLFLNPAEAFESTVAEEIKAPWEGFGYNQWPYARKSDGDTYKVWDEDLWCTTVSRVKAIRPSLVRMPVLPHWIKEKSDGTWLPAGQYNWESSEMKSFFKVMDLYKQLGIHVMAGFWWLSDSYASQKDDIDTDECAVLQADFIEYLIRTKDYGDIVTCYAPVNEPLGVSGVTYAKWSAMIVKLHTELTARGLPVNLLSGADSWGDWIWKPAQQNAGELSAYDFHNYLNDTPDDTYSQLYGRTVESALASYVSNIHKYDNSGKPVHLSEMAPIGASYIDWPVDEAPSHCRIDTYEYGLGFWDYGIQLARAGISSGLAWAFDGLEANKNAGMWNNAGTYGGMTLRPWYYTWQLMCRYFLAGATILKMTELPDRKDIRILGARIGEDDYSYCVVNRRMDAGSCTRQVSFQANSAKPVYLYRYSKASHGDGLSLTLPYEKLEGVSFSTGITVEVPMEEGVFLTTMEPFEWVDAPVQSAFHVDFESMSGYMLLGEQDRGVNCYLGTNPRKREPNTSDGVAYTEVTTTEKHHSADSYGMIAPVGKLEIGAKNTTLSLDLYRTRAAKVAIAAYIEGEGLKGYEFSIDQRKWTPLSIDLSPYSGKGLQYIAVFPYRDSVPSSFETEMLVVDNILLSDSQDSLVKAQDIHYQTDPSYARYLDLDFEYYSSVVMPAPSDSFINAVITANPKKQENNSSAKACKFTVLSACPSPEQSSVCLSLYPYVELPENLPYLNFSCYRQAGQAEQKIIVHFLSGNKAEGTFSCLRKRTWLKSSLDLSQYKGEVMTDIEVFPTTQLTDSIISYDITYFDDFLLSADKAVDLEPIEENAPVVYTEGETIHITGAEGFCFSIWSVDGRHLHSGYNACSEVSVPAAKGIYIVVTDDVVTKVAVW